MADILTRCPTTRRTIPTGLDTSTVVFESLPNVPVPVRCPVCGSQHQWTVLTAWVGEVDGTVLKFPTPNEQMRAGRENVTPRRRSLPN